MAIHPKEGRLLYHLTSVENFDSILRNGLHPRITVENDFIDIANQEIIQHRKIRGLDSFVPFHFFCSNPFDGAVQKSFSEKKFIFITIQRSFARNNNFQILKRHPLSTNCGSLMTYDEGFNAIEWDKMGTRDYSDNECKEICMAECLSPRVILPNEFFCVFAPSQDIYNQLIKVRDSLVGNDAFQISVLTNAFIK